MWRAPGMLDLAVLSVFGFSGYAALLAVAPLWAVNGGATAAGSGLVNGVLLAATVLAQLGVPRALARWGTGRVLVAGLLLLGVPGPAYLLSDQLGWILGALGRAGTGVRDPHRGRIHRRRPAGAGRPARCRDRGLRAGGRGPQPGAAARIGAGRRPVGLRAGLLGGGAPGARGAFRAPAGRVLRDAAHARPPGPARAPR